MNPINMTKRLADRLLGKLLTRTSAAAEVCYYKYRCSPVACVNGSNMWKWYRRAECQQSGVHPWYAFGCCTSGMG